MTAKQRAKIYRKAADVVAKAQITSARFFSCNAICRAATGSNYYMRLYNYRVQNLNVKNFPEFFMFSPRPKSSTENSWFNSISDERNRTARIIALLLSEQIALNP